MFNTMLRTFLCVIFLIYIQRVISESKFTQQAGRVKCYAAEYVSNCSAITRRVARGRPYTTNVTFTTLKPFGNNLLLKFSLNSGNIINMLSIKTTLCECQKTSWGRNIIDTYTNLPPRCPLPPGSYRMFNLEFPPKESPWPWPKGKFEFKFTAELTDAKVLLADFHLALTNH